MSDIEMLALLMKNIDVRGPDDCWVWLKSKARKGYGRATIRGRNLIAHRAVLSAHLGRHLKRWEFACHTCDNPPCCNPAHLWVGTVRDNVDDMIAKGRSHAGKRNGSDNPRAKITEADVPKIRADKRPNTLIARDFAISRSQVSYIKSRKYWGHVL